MSNFKAKKAGARWQGFYKFGGYWFVVKKSFRVATFTSPEAARAAAHKAMPSFTTRAT